MPPAGGTGPTLSVYRILDMDDAEEGAALRQKCKEVKEITPSVLKLVDNMADTMRAAKGAGLAAPQIGVAKRVIVVDVGEGPVSLINPEISEMQGQEVDTEGCLSAPGLFCDVPRALRARVRGLDRHGRPVDWHVEGWAARVFQHEVDHLDGILFTDRAVAMRKSRQEG